MSDTLALSASETLATAFRVNWRRAAGYGVLWGVASTAFESFALPLGDLSAAELLVFLVRMLPRMCLTGVMLASAAMLLERRLTWVLMAPALVTFSLLACAAICVVNLAWAEFRSWPSEGPEGLIEMLHAFWGFMIYSGLFVAIYRLTMRSERTRALLARSEVARQQTDALFSQAQLLALQGHVDPTFLLRVMIEIERRYASDTAAMDRLLDPSVNFLRAAMPGVRSGASTLAAELLLAEQYAQVWAELEPGRVTWSIKVEGAMPDLRFPPLLLLPVLDQLAADVPARHAALRVSHADGRCTLRSLARPQSCRKPWLAPGLLYRLQVGLRTVFGDDWTLAVTDGSASPALLLMLPLERPGRTA